MNTKSVNKEVTEEALRDSKILQRHCELLIKQSDNWLSEEEGLKNLAKRNKKRFFLFIIFLFVITSCSPEMNREPVESLPENADLMKARQYYRVANDDSALVYLNQALVKADTANYEELAGIYLLRSRVSSNLAQYEKSMEDAFKLLSISEQHQFNNHKASALICIGLIHLRMFNIDKAEDYLLQAKSMAEENNLETEMIQVCGILSTIYAEQNRNNEVLPLLNKALEVAQKKSDTLNTIQCLNHIGGFYNQIGHIENSNAYHQTAKKYMDDALKLALTTTASLLISDIRLSLLMWCLEDKKYMEALKHAQEIQKELNSDNPNNTPILIQVYDHLVTIYSFLGDAKRAVDAHRQYSSMMAGLSDKNLHQALQEVSVKYQTAEKELEILNQQNQIDKQKNRLYISVSCLLAAIVLLVLLLYINALRTRRNHLLAEMNATKDKFFSIISHDLQNPILALRNALQALIDHSNNMDAQALKQYYAELLKSTDSQVGLLYDLLNWAKLQSGRMAFYPQPFNLKALIDGTTSILKTHIENKNISLNVDVPDEPMVVRADRTMLATVLRNLITNAVKFTHEGGQIGLSVAASQQGVKMSVKDNGVGMDEETLHNLFRLDRQSSRVGTAGEQGSGLGLIVCKEFIEKNGGKLTVESKVGQGSKITIEL